MDEVHQNHPAHPPPYLIRTARLHLTPVSGADLPGLIALKADPMVFAQMLGGVRDAWQVMQELAEDRLYWAQHRVGLFSIYEEGHFQGITGIHTRPDGRGQALRFAVWPEARGRGLAREAACAALRFAHDQAGLKRVIAVANAENFGSRSILGGIGMWQSQSFTRQGHQMLIYESTLP